MENEICPKCKLRNREKYKDYLRPTCWMCRVGHISNRNRNQKYRASLREQILRHYGNKCVCCGEEEKRFLTFDHKNNDGGKFRKQFGKDNTVLFRWIINRNFPDSIQVLCYNCNCGRAANNGICPHKLNNAF
jgi:hypothetical protein